MVDGRNVVPDVWDVLDKIKNFSEKVGRRTGAAGQKGVTTNYCPSSWSVGMSYH
jgi:hypothetical protein